MQCGLGREDNQQQEQGSGARTKHLTERYHIQLNGK
jgi:hypothetical protein